MCPQLLIFSPQEGSRSVKLVCLRRLKSGLLSVRRLDYGILKSRGGSTTLSSLEEGPAPIISMDSKEEISDTDSGIILQSGLDSPTSPVKDAGARTCAVKMRLQERLEECLQELKKLCIREAELTGHLSSDYPLLPGEKPPNIRRRVGTAFKLDEETILQGGEHPELGPLEAELALQQQIYEAARRLYREEHLSKAVKRSRLQQSRAAERRLKELQEAVFQLRLQLGRGSPRPLRHDDLTDPGTSDDGSLSDSALQDEDEEPSQGSERSLEAFPEPNPPETASESPSHRLVPHKSPPSPYVSHQLEGTPNPHSSDLFYPQSLLPPVLEHPRPSYTPDPDYDRPPIQNSPWTESSLDEPYEKPKKKNRSSRSSQASSPAVTPLTTPVSTPLDPHFGSSVHPLQLTAIKSLELRNAQSNSAPCTPELQIRRQQSLSFRMPYRQLSHEPDPRLARRRVTDLGAAVGECGPLQVGLGTTLYPSGSEDNCSECSAPSSCGSPCYDYSPVEPADLLPAPFGYLYSGPPAGLPAYNGCHGASPGGPQPYSAPYERPLDFPGSHDRPPAHTSPCFYKNPLPHSNPGFYRGFVEDDGGYPLEMDMGRLYLGSPAPPGGPPSRYEYWYEDDLPLRLTPRPRLPPPHPRLSRAPSLRDHPPSHPPTPTTGVLPLLLANRHPGIFLTAASRGCHRPHDPIPSTEKARFERGAFRKGNPPSRTHIANIATHSSTNCLCTDTWNRHHILTSSRGPPMELQSRGCRRTVRSLARCS
ncbi:hypothetical protein GJAV_G00171630 [Gymnothorax javanicus]|nr:hypothetical protein GJAV_G00171630 [Gymnothorax javanicus]